MNAREKLLSLLQMMVEGRYISEWKMGYILGFVDMATMTNKDCFELWTKDGGEE